MRNIIRLVLIGLILIFSVSAHSRTINFSGQLDLIEVDAGGAVYSGASLGTDFWGAIDDVSASGFISDIATATSFGCCIAAGGLDISNNHILNQSDADTLNHFLGPVFSAGDEIDGINIEGDAVTVGGVELKSVCHLYWIQVYLVMIVWIIILLNQRILFLRCFSSLKKMVLGMIFILASVN